MGSLRETNPSLWVATTAPTDDPVDPTPLPSEPLDVVVIGGGIAGLTAARLLAADGARVAVLEAGRLSSGVTGYTTAKVTALQGTTLGTLRDKHGDERTAAYAAANRAAVERVARFVEEDGIDCDFERAPAVTYAASEDEAVAKVEAEHEAATACGLPTRLSVATELPYEVRAAVWLDDQAQFHPRKYCLALARAFAEAGGIVAERTRVHDVDEDDDGVTVQTDRGELRANECIVATHLPFLMAGAYFARAHPTRSYALAGRWTKPGAERAERPKGMYISADSTTRSIRSTPDDWLILGGEGHKVGHDDDTRRRYETLVNWAKENFEGIEIVHQWSAQDYQTVDGIPYIGPVTSGRPRTHVATGFRKWGMTNGTVAGMILADVIGGRPNAWAEAFDSTRLEPTKSMKSLVSENLEVGKRFVADRFQRTRDASELKPDEGDIVELDGDTVAAYRDADGTLHALSPVCTHMGCRVNFNTAERSWDCPCHGSRFGTDGRVLQGPATKDLAPADATDHTDAAPAPADADAHADAHDAAAADDSAADRDDAPAPAAADDDSPIDA